MPEESSREYVSESDRLLLLRHGLATPEATTESAQLRETR
jgi:hypothetical protein